MKVRGIKMRTVNLAVCGLPAAYLAARGNSALGEGKNTMSAGALYSSLSQAAVTS